MTIHEYEATVRNARTGCGAAVAALIKIAMQRSFLARRAREDLGSLGVRVAA